jgi:chromosomal replication initiation ATPase DnaA
MSLVERAQAIRERLRNPPNAVPDLGIDLKRLPPAPAKAVAAPQYETEAALIERQIKHHRGRLECALARREKLFGKRNAPRIEDIQDVVCAVFGVEKSEMMSRRKTPHLVMPRHVAMFLSKEMTGLSLPGIGRKFAFRDHTGLRPNDPDLDNKIAIVEAMLASHSTNLEGATCNSPQTPAI